MPTRTRDDGTPIVFFDVTVELSPFTLFRRLDENRAPMLVDIRREPDQRGLRGSAHQPDPEWRPADSDMEVVLYDDDGSLAVAAAQRLQQAGFGRVKALFGGLDLYEFSLDPEVLGSDTYLDVSEGHPGPGA